MKLYPYSLGSSKRIRTSQARNPQNTNSNLERKSCQLLPFTRKGGSFLSSPLPIISLFDFHSPKNRGEAIYDTDPLTRGGGKIETYNHMYDVWQGSIVLFSTESSIYLTE